MTSSVPFLVGTVKPITALFKHGTEGWCQNYGKQAVFWDVGLDDTMHFFTRHKKSVMISNFRAV